MNAPNIPDPNSTPEDGAHGAQGVEPHQGNQEPFNNQQYPHGPQQPGGPAYAGANYGAHPGANYGARPGAAYKAAPKPPSSESAGPARTITVGSTPRSFMRVMIAIVGALALLVPASALAYSGVNLASLVHKETTYDLSTGASSLAIDVDTAAVKVSVSDAFDEPRVRHVYQGPDTTVQTPQISDASGTTTVHMPQRSETVQWWAPNPELEDTLHVELPTDYAGDLGLTVTSGWGFTDVAGTFANVNAESEAGAITLDVTAGDVSAKTRAGFIDVRGAMDNLSLATSTGYIETSQVDVSESVSAKANTGAIDLGLGENMVPRNGIEAHARTGTVDVGLPTEDRVRGMDVAGYSVNASAASGTVEVEVQQMSPGEGVIPVTASASSGAVHVFYQDDVWGTDDIDGDEFGNTWDDDWDHGWDDSDSGTDGGADDMSGDTGEGFGGPADGSGGPDDGS